MPGWLRSKMIEQSPIITVRELCTLARQMTIRDLCRKDGYPEDGFNEISTTVSDNLISALSNLNATQKRMEQKLKSMDHRIKRIKNQGHHRGGPESNTMTIASPSPYVENTQWPNSQILSPDSKQEETFIIGVNADFLDNPIPETTNLDTLTISRTIVCREQKRIQPEHHFGFGDKKLI